MLVTDSVHDTFPSETPLNQCPVRMPRVVVRGCLCLLKPTRKSLVDSEVLQHLLTNLERNFPRGKLQYFSPTGASRSEWAVVILCTVLGFSALCLGSSRSLVLVAHSRSHSHRPLCSNLQLRRRYLPPGTS